MTAFKKYIGDSQSLMRSDTFWESVGHLYPQSVFEVTENFEIKHYNESFLSMVGAKKKNLVNTDWFNFIRSQELDKFKKIINYVFDKFSSRTARTLFVHS